MTISNTTVKARYAGPGAGPFAITFDYQNESEITVVKRDENVSPATETLLTISTDYTLDSPATEVTLNVALVGGESVTIYRSTALTQATDYLETGTFPADSHENALDKNIQIAQENSEKLGRVFAFDISADVSSLDLTFPAATADYLIGWNSAGTALESKDPSSLTLVGVGDVVGPGSATDNAIARFDTATGKLIQNSGVTIDDSDVISGPTRINVDNLRLDGNAITSTNLNGDIQITPDGSGAVVLDGLNWPTSDGANGTFLTTNGSGDLSFSSGAAGDVTGPASATDNAIARYDGVSGTDLNNSGVTIDDLNNIAGANSLDVANLTLQSNDIISSDVNGDINITPNGTGSIVLDGLNWPQADGTPNQVIATDGAGQLAFATGQSGDVVGPGASTDNAIVRWDTATGQLVQNSIGILSDTGELSGLTRLNTTEMELFNNRLTTTTLDSDLDIVSNGTGSIVLDSQNWPKADGLNGQTLTTDGAGQLSWATPAGGGDVLGPGASTDNALVRWNGASGTAIQDSSAILDDTDALTGLTSLTVDNVNIDGNAIISTDVNGDLTITPNGTGDLVLDGLNWPQADGTNGEVLTTNGAGQLTFAAAAGTGDVVGPAGATDNAIARYDTATGKLLQDSLVLIDDVGAVSGATQLDVDNIRVDGNAITSTDLNGNITITPNGTGDIVLDGQNWPQADGTVGQILSTNGAGQLSWIDNDQGDVVGPGASTDNALVRWDGVTGALVQNSVGILDDAGALSGLTQLDVDNMRLDGNTLSSTDLNGDINLTPNGTGNVDIIGVTVSDANAVTGVTSLDVDNVNVDGNTISSTDVNGNLILTPNGTGDLVLDGVNWPQADGTVNQVLTTDGAGQTSWEDASGGGGWTTSKVTTNQTLADNTEYVANSASQLEFALPATAAVGWRAAVVGFGSGGWKITQNAGQKIQRAGSEGSTGVDGGLVAGSSRDVVEIVCTETDNIFAIVDSEGNSEFISGVGYMVGGSADAGGSGEHDEIDKFDLITENITAGVNNLANGNLCSSAGIDGIGGVGAFLGGFRGFGGSNITAVERMIYASDSSSNSTEVLATARGETTGITSSTTGYVIGGNTGTVPVRSDSVSSIESYDVSGDAIGTVTDTAQFGQWAQHDGVASSTDGYWSSGRDTSGTRHDDLEKMVFATETTSVLTAVLDQNQHQGGSTHSSTKGYFGWYAGSAGGNTNTIEDIDFSADTSNAIVDTFVASRVNGSACHSGSIAIFAGCANAASDFNGGVDTTEKFTHSTEAVSAIAELTTSDRTNRSVSSQKFN